MREIFHRVSGGLAALSAAALVTFATDITTKPTSWALPVAAAALIFSCVTWLLTQGAGADRRALVAPNQSGDGEQNTLAHTGTGDIVQRQHVEHHHHAREPTTTRTTVDADRETYEDLVGLLTRNEISFLNEHDFGNVWARRLTWPLFELVETRNSAEYEFHDEVLEERRGKLFDAATEMVKSLAANSHWTRNGAEMLELVGSERRREEPPEGEHFERYESCRQELNRLADAVVKTYDELIREARTRLP